MTGHCPNPNCHYAHVVKLHATISEASSIVPPTNNNKQQQSYHHQQQTQRAAISAISIWNQPDGSVKFFSSSHDGYWRLWNPLHNFGKEFETQVGTSVDCLTVLRDNTTLVCGMQAPCNNTSGLQPVGMVHAWNLQQPHAAPLEGQVDPPLLPYAHNQGVSCLCASDSIVVTGSRDGSIRVWKELQLQQSLVGHARQVTGLVLVNNDATLWSSGTDGSIRIWDLAGHGKCQYVITAAQNGHADAITCLTSFLTHGQVFVLSASLDSTIKVWNASTGECVASESHGGEGVTSMAIVESQDGTKILLVGLVSGNICARNLVQTPNCAAFEALFVLTSKFNMGHASSVKCLTAGPQATFYSGSDDGQIMVWQIAGDLKV